MRINNFLLYRLSIMALYISLNGVNCYAETQTAETHYEQGLKYYETENYESARVAFEQAVKISPKTAKYHHMLGKSYGRVAQKSNWIKAMYLAKKTLKEFQVAVELDKQDKQVIADLIEYYLQAPAFLGGSDKKANLLKQQLEELQKNTGERS